MPDLLPGEDPDIRQELQKVVSASEQWLRTPSDVLGGLAPEELVGTPEEKFLWDLVHRIKHGITS